MYNSLLHHIQERVALGSHWERTFSIGVFRHAIKKMFHLLVYYTKFYETWSQKVF